MLRVNFVNRNQGKYYDDRKRQSHRGFLRLSENTLKNTRLFVFLPEGESLFSWKQGGRLEKELEGKKADDELKVTVQPEDAYGARVDQLVTKVPRTEFKGISELKPGIQLQAQTDQGVQIFTVVDVNDSEVTLDANHPLAGQTLHFEVTVKGVRDATSEELTHGHAHGPGGHQH